MSFRFVWWHKLQVLMKNRWPILQLCDGEWKKSSSCNPGLSSEIWRLKSLSCFSELTFFFQINCDPTPVLYVFRHVSHFCAISTMNVWKRSSPSGHSDYGFWYFSHLYFLKCLLYWSFFQHPWNLSVCHKSLLHLLTGSSFFTFCANFSFFWLLISWF